MNNKKTNTLPAGRQVKKILKVIFYGIFFLLPVFALANNPPNYNYIPMEQIPGQPGVPTDFYTYVSYLYQFGIGAVGIAALLMLAIGGFMYITSAGNNASMEKAKGVITDAIVGVILALTAYLLLYTINPDLVRIKRLTPVPVSNLTIPGAPGGPGGPGPALPPGTQGANCQGAATNSNLCVNTTCSRTCSNLGQFESSIQTYASQSGLDPRVVKAVICRESSGTPNVQNTAVSPTACGLMQVNVSSGTTCATDPRGNLLDPQTNIRVGTGILAQKYASVRSYSYASITPYQMAFAAYNCCANGDNPNAASRDCGSAVPKWACPINPGTGTYNMCAVQNYACDVSACVFSY